MYRIPIHLASLRSIRMEAKGVVVWQRGTGDRIFSDDQTGLGNLARYIIRACFSPKRMVYIPAGDSQDGTAKVVYTSRDRKSGKIFNPLDWLARLTT